MPEDIQIAPLQPEQPEPAAPPAEALNPDTPAAEPEPIMIPKARLDEVLSENKALKAEREKELKAAEKAQREQLEQQQQYKQLYEAEQAKAAEAQATAERVQRERLQLEVATAGGAPGLWKRVQGGTKEEMEADFAELLKEFPNAKPPAPDLNGGAGPGGRKPAKPAPTEAEIREMAAVYNISPQLLAEQYGVQLPSN